MPPSKGQHFAILREVETAKNLIRAGLRELQQINSVNDFYHLPILLLASGFERLMKTILCLEHLNNKGEYPGAEIFPPGAKGHNLVLFLEQIQKSLYGESYRQIPAARADDKHLSDPRVKKSVQILSDFGIAARYYELNVVLGKTNKTKCPDKEWDSLESMALDEHPEMRDRFFADPLSTDVYPTIITSLVADFERLARALARLFTIGNLGAQAEQCSVVIYDFLVLHDDELGQRQY